MRFSIIVLIALLALVACAQTDAPSTRSDVPASVMPTVAPSPTVVAPIAPASSVANLTTPEPTPVEIPPLPLISLVHDGRVYPGLRGSYTWPSMTIPGKVGFTHADAFNPDPSYAIPILAGDTLTVKIAANTPPSSIEADIWISTPGNVVENLVIEPGFKAPITFDLPDGVYVVNVKAKWNETIAELNLWGNISYAFEIEVGSSGAKSAALQDIKSDQATNALSRVLANMPLSFKSEGIWFSHPALALEIAGQTQVYNLREFFDLTEQERQNYIDALSGVPIAQPSVLGHARDYSDEWQETFGFDYFEVDLSVTTGETMLARHTPAYIEGNFDEAIIRQKLLAFGYEEREGAGSVYYAKWLDNQVDLRDSNNRVAMDLMNRVFVGNGSLVTAPATKQMEDIMETMVGELLSLAEDPAFAAISEALGDVVDAVIMTRSSILESDEAKAVVYEKPDQWGTLHQWNSVGFGRRITDDGARRQFVVLYYPDSDAADADADELISRLNNYISSILLMYPEVKSLVAGSPERPLSGCNFEVSLIDSTESGSTLTVSCIRVDGGSLASLLHLVSFRDLGFLLP